MDSIPRWYLLKAEGGETFGPVAFDQISEWAASAQISPMDKLSNDGVTWSKAPSVPELKMDWLISLPDDQYYGPTSKGSVEEFLHAGEITGDTIVINCVDAAELTVRDIPSIDLSGNRDRGLPGPGKTGIRRNLQQRIRDLERALLEERRSLEMAEDRYKKLEARFAEATGVKP